MLCNLKRIFEDNFGKFPFQNENFCAEALLPFLLRGGVQYKLAPTVDKGVASQKMCSFAALEVKEAKESDFFVLFFQVFGLGNKTYEHYNKVAIYVDKRLEELGGSRVYELGLGDDDAK
jgi:Flavodoxin